MWGYGVDPPSDTDDHDTNCGYAIGSLGRLVFAQVKNVGVQLGSSAMRAPPDSYVTTLTGATLTGPAPNAKPERKAFADGIATAVALPRSAAAGL